MGNPNRSVSDCPAQCRQRRDFEGAQGALAIVAVNRITPHAAQGNIDFIGQQANFATIKALQSRHLRYYGQAP